MGSDFAGDGRGEVISVAYAKRELAREIAAHLFADVIRVHGRGARFFIPVLASPGAVSVAEVDLDDARTGKPSMPS